MKPSALLFLLASSLAWGGLDFESRIVEVQAAADAREVPVEFNFSNTGSEQVIISHINPDCDCITVQAKGGTVLPNKSIRYRPGETGVIRSSFKVGNASGTVDQILAIWLEGDPKDEPSIQLTARITIPELVSMEPKALKWMVGSEPATQRITITMNHDKPIAVTRMASSSKSFRAELKTLEAGRKYEVLVTPLSTEGPGIGVIRVETDCEVESQRNQQSFIMIQRSP